MHNDGNFFLPMTRRLPVAVVMHSRTVGTYLDNLANVPWVVPMRRKRPLQARGRFRESHVKKEALSATPRHHGTVWHRPFGLASPSNFSYLKRWQLCMFHIVHRKGRKSWSYDVCNP